MAEWEIEESVRWLAILGIGFGVPGLLTASSVFQTHSGYFAYFVPLILLSLSVLFLKSHRRKHRNPLVPLRKTEFAVSPDEIHPGEVVCCDIRIPATMSIVPRGWAVSLNAFQEGLDDNEEIPDLDLICSVTFYSEISKEQLADGFYALRGHLLVPREPSLCAGTNDPKLNWKIGLRLDLGRWGMWSLQNPPSVRVISRN